MGQLDRARIAELASKYIREQKSVADAKQSIEHSELRLSSAQSRMESLLRDMASSLPEDESSVYVHMPDNLLIIRLDNGQVVVESHEVLEGS